MNRFNPKFRITNRITNDDVFKAQYEAFAELYGR